MASPYRHDFVKGEVIRSADSNTNFSTLIDYPKGQRDDYTYSGQDYFLVSKMHVSGTIKVFWNGVLMKDGSGYDYFVGGYNNNAVYPTTAWASLLAAGDSISLQYNYKELT